MVEIDASVTYLSQLGPEGVAEPGVAADISERAARAQETLANVSALVADIERVARGRPWSPRGAGATLHAAGSPWAPLAASIAGLLFAGLNVLLFQQGRRWSSRR